METTLNAIEESTRRTAIQTVDVVQNDINRYWPYMEHINTTPSTLPEPESWRRLIALARRRSRQSGGS